MYNSIIVKGANIYRGEKLKSVIGLHSVKDSISAACYRRYLCFDGVSGWESEGRFTSSMVYLDAYTVAALPESACDANGACKESRIYDQAPDVLFRCDGGLDGLSILSALTAQP